MSRTRPPNLDRALAALAAALPLAAHAAGAGHLGLALSGDDYSPRFFEGGRENDSITWSRGLTAKYLWADDSGRWPTLGAAISRWQNDIEGDCCGFDNERIDSTLTAADLLWGSLRTQGDGTREAWYVLLGVTSLETEATFNPKAPAGSRKSARGRQIGVGFFAGGEGASPAASSCATRNSTTFTPGATRFR